MTTWRLLVDVGGTNVRFARAFDDGTILQCRSYLVSQFPAFMSALGHYLSETGGSARCSGAAIGAAGPVDSGTVSLTNAPWVINEGEVRSSIGAPCILINDLEAAAMSLPVLSAEDFLILGEPRLRLSTTGRLLITNIGTGFGAATLLKADGGWITCPSEAGHMSLALPLGLDLNLNEQFVSVEHVLSGRGLSNLHCAVGNDVAAAVPTDILVRANADLSCAKVLHFFTRVLGEVLGNLALAVAAWDGVFLYGSVAKAFVGVASVDVLRQAFENKGVMSERLRRIPIALVVKENAPLIGLAAMPMPERV
jgi:glucokinase